MKISILTLAILIIPLSLASDPYPAWDGWKIDAHSVGCDLYQNYWLPYKEKPVPQGFLSDTKFNRAHVHFIANTFSHGDIIKEEDLGKIRFLLQLEPVTASVDDDQKISIARIAGFETPASIYPTRDIHQFWLEGDNSMNLLKKIENDEVIDFSLFLESGKIVEFEIYPSGNRNGHVWVAMFNTCVREHVKK